MLELPGIFTPFDRDRWAGRDAGPPPHLGVDEAARMQGQIERVGAQEMQGIYLPLARLVHLHAEAGRQLGRQVRVALGGEGGGRPFLVGIAGSVAAGKSTTSRVLCALIGRLPGAPRVEIVNTDGFLRPTAFLEANGLMHRKGFPESYDQEAMIQTLAAIRVGGAAVEVPLYSHHLYDVVPDRRQVVCAPDIVLVEGLNVLDGPSSARDRAPFVQDLIDFTIYVDASLTTLKAWYLDRFMLFRRRAMGDAEAFFHRFTRLSENDARHFAEQVWHEINERNLVQHILPRRASARIILHKTADHRVQRVYVRDA